MGRGLAERVGRDLAEIWPREGGEVGRRRPRWRRWRRASELLLCAGAGAAPPPGAAITASRERAGQSSEDEYLAYDPSRPLPAVDGRYRPKARAAAARRAPSPSFPRPGRRRLLALLAGGWEPARLAARHLRATARRGGHPAVLRRGRGCGRRAQGGVGNCICGEDLFWGRPPEAGEGERTAAIVTTLGYTQHIERPVMTAISVFCKGLQGV